MSAIFVEKTDRLGRVIRYEYDNLYRLLEENWLDEYEQVVYTIFYTYLCPCQLARAEFAGDFVFFGASPFCGTAEKRLAGGAGGGNERPCPAARGGRKSGQDAGGREAAAIFVLSA